MIIFLFPDEILFSQEKCLSLYKEKLEKESNTQDKKYLILELDKTKQTLEKVLAEQKEEKVKFEKEKEKLLGDKKKLENGSNEIFQSFNLIYTFVSIIFRL